MNIIMIRFMDFFFSLGGSFFLVIFYMLVCIRFVLYVLWLCMILIVVLEKL